MFQIRTRLRRIASARPANHPKRFLVWAGGGDVTALQGSRSATNAAIGLGGTVLTTAVLAAAAMTLAMHDLLHLATPVAAVVGVAWGVAVLNLDRWMIAVTRRQSKAWQTVLMALPRVALAVIIGFVIAEPLVLRTFSSEVTAQARVDKQVALADGQREVDADYASIPKLEAEQADLQETLRSGGDAQYAENPDFVAANEQHQAARDAVAKAQIATGCEAGGTCGTGRRGCGPVCRAKVRVLDQRKREAHESYERLQAVRARLSREALRSGRLARAAARPELQRVQATLATQRAERDRLLAQHLASYSDPIGLLDREEALAHLSDARPAIGRTALIFRLFLLAIDIAPILFKTLLLLGKETGAERIQRELEDRELGRVEATEDAHDEAHDASVELLVVEARALGKALEQEMEDAVRQVAAIQRTVWQQQIDDFRAAVASAQAGPPKPPGLLHTPAPRAGRRGTTGP